MSASNPTSNGGITRWAGYGAAVLGVLLMTAVLALVPGIAHIANVSMLYLLVVIAAALRFGSGPAIFASLFSFFAFDWFFVRPHFTLTVSDPSEWLALLMFLITAVCMGQLTALLRSQADEARRRERETAALAEASWAVASQLDQERALAEVLQQIVDVVPAHAAAILTLSEGVVQVVACLSVADGSSRFADETTLRAARFVLDENRAIAWDDLQKHWEKGLPEPAQRGVAYLPLTAEDRVLGVLGLQLPPEYRVTRAERRVVESLANHAAVVLERERLARAEARANALVEADRLKTALLSMVSHDFRSPLASIKASATASLQEGGAADAEAQRELQVGIIREADRLNDMVGNILHLSRLDADAWRPRLEEAALEEVVEAARSGLSREANARIEVQLDPAVSDVWLDPVQIGQVLHNLLDNALKYSPPGTRVELRAAWMEDELLLDVLDHGPGLPPGEEGRVFERFYRAPQLRESAVPGVGIGLSICRGLVEAHGGTLTAENRPGGGAHFQVRLPRRRDG